MEELDNSRSGGFFGGFNFELILLLLFLFVFLGDGGFGGFGGLFDSE